MAKKPPSYGHHVNRWQKPSPDHMGESDAELHAHHLGPEEIAKYEGEYGQQLRAEAWEKALHIPLRVLKGTFGWM